MVDATQQRPIANPGKLAAADNPCYAKDDFDKNGRIDLWEKALFKRADTSGEGHLSKPEYDRLMKEFDIGKKDGKITKDEYYAAVSRTKKQP
jgi:EF hand